MCYKRILGQLDKVFDLGINVFQFLSLLNALDDFGVRGGDAKIREELESCSYRIFLDGLDSSTSFAELLFDCGNIRRKIDWCFQFGLKCRDDLAFVAVLADSIEMCF